MAHTIEVTPALPSMQVIGRTKEAVYLRLPKKLQRDCIGGCGCEHCTKNPALAKWDTMVVSIRGKDDHSWTVHLPDPAVAAFNEYWRRKEAKANA